MGTLMAFVLTGAAMNPARAFGPELVANDWGSDWWIWYVGPFAGGVIAAVLYELLYLRSPEPAGMAAEAQAGGPLEPDEPAVAGSPSCRDRRPTRPPRRPGGRRRTSRPELAQAASAFARLPARCCSHRALHDVDDRARRHGGHLHRLRAPLVVRLPARETPTFPARSGAGSTSLLCVVLFLLMMSHGRRLREGRRGGAAPRRRPRRTRARPLHRDHAGADGPTDENAVPAEYANGDAAAGKVVFTSKGCGACHTLAGGGRDRHGRPEPRRGEALTRR